LSTNRGITVNRTAIVSAALLVLLAGCSRNTEPGLWPADSDNASTWSKDSASSAPAPAEPEYTILSKADLNGALLSIQDMPTGYSQEPPSKSAGNKFFCDYKPPFEEKMRVRRDFTKGGGLSAQVLSFTLRQYADADKAEAAFDALTKTLETCRVETYQGSKLVYAPMSAPKVGESSVGARITSDGTTILQNFALVGPTLISAGAGGLIDVNADEVAGLLEDQVNAYETAATA
jgi:hypothetical protein